MEVFHSPLEVCCYLLAITPHLLKYVYGVSLSFVGFTLWPTYVGYERSKDDTIEVCRIFDIAFGNTVLSYRRLPLSI